MPRYKTNRGIILTDTGENRTNWPVYFRLGAEEKKRRT